MVARNVSGLSSPFSEGFSICMLQICYVVFCVLLDTSRCCGVVWRTQFFIQPHNLIIKHCVSCWIAYVLQDITRSIQYQVNYYKIFRTVAHWFLSWARLIYCFFFNFFSLGLISNLSSNLVLNSGFGIIHFKQFFLYVVF